jgi:hypothetical protein
MLVVAREGSKAAAAREGEMDPARGKKARKWEKDTKIEGTNSSIYCKQMT